MQKPVVVFGGMMEIDNLKKAGNMRRFPMLAEVRLGNNVHEDFFVQDPVKVL